MKLEPRTKVRLIRWFKERNREGWMDDFSDILEDLSRRVDSERQFNRIVKSCMNDIGCKSIPMFRKLINHRLSD